MTQEQDVTPHRPQRRRPSWAVSLVLVITALTTIATSEQELPTLDANWWVGQIEGPSRITINLGMGGADWLREADGKPTFIELYLVSRTDLDEIFPEAIWRLVTVEGQPFPKHGMFMGNAPGNSRGAVAWMGRVCPADEREDADCLPCDVTSGCELEINVSLCGIYSRLSSPPGLYVRLTDEDGRVLSCDTGCGREGSITRSPVALEADICDEMPSEE